MDVDILFEELSRRLREPALVLVDVLPAESYTGSHIAGARSLPVADVPQRAAEVVPDRDTEIVVYCGSATCPLAAEAAVHLRGLGYTCVRHYHDGLAGWTEAGGLLEGEDTVSNASFAGDAPPPSRLLRARLSLTRGSAFLDFIERQSPMRLLGGWVAMIVASALMYWVSGLFDQHGLSAGGEPVGLSARSLLTAVYFSFITATSVGYGDVVPLGFARAVAVVEAVAGLLIFGAVVAKFVSRRQDELVREIHRVTFEERLDRVQTNLHMVLSELQVIAALCDDGGAMRPERVGSRLESAALVFVGELRAIHDLLYRPQWAPEEEVLAAILASLAASMRELRELLSCLPPAVVRTPTLAKALRATSNLAEGICGECVPRSYAPGLTVWMDRIRDTARSIR